MPMLKMINLACKHSNVVSTVTKIRPLNNTIDHSLTNISANYRHNIIFCDLKAYFKICYAVTAQY